MNTFGRTAQNVFGINNAYDFGEDARLTLTNRYYEYDESTQSYEMKVMPEGFPQLKIIDDDAGSGENFKLTLRFHRFASKIFYDPFWEFWDTNRFGTLRVFNDVCMQPHQIHFGGSRDLKVYDFFNSAMRRLPKDIRDSLEPQFDDESYFYLLVDKVMETRP